MELYHASTVSIEHPVILNRHNCLDFGTGFYTTASRIQAEDFARRVYYRRGQEGRPTVNVYVFDEATAQRDLQTLRFDGPDESWLDFVVHNRRKGRDSSCGADLIIGPVANDDVFQTVALYEAGQIDAEAAIKRFKIKTLFNQYLFVNEKALGYLTFEQSYVPEDTL